MTLRILPPDEYPRLLATECSLWQAHRTAMAGGHILVAENAQGEIVGTVYAMVSLHLDGLWVHPDYRRGGTFHRIGRAILRMADAVGVEQMFAVVKNPTLADWLTRRLEAEPADLLRIPVRR